MTCPICTKKTDPKYRPFCSRRCADIDLGRWLTGGYAIPSTDPEDADDLPEAMENAAKSSPDRPH
ncbi:DNA gyrase inhibitor YacG [Rhodophyticola sp. CCM32]|uniref:DNA gyrase inhibitor YacG n=1 Tax=Rhodophyticola sp. CCM32 TaxID=2916397 RepID=UPI00107F2A8C|nr:DNA gyrase inhibitor YacG [Rhodophyticola sp. CCM32]QBY02630.1 DNA gyrase inhibitor YacG [Rhodophyticola sp. CCM32]